MKNILIAGESWINITTHIKGFDSFQTTVYKEGVSYIRNAFQKAGYDVTFIPNHLVATDFPTKKEELNKFDIVVLSDIGSNNLVLSQSVFTQGLQKSNRLEMLKEYVMEDGKALLMVGGYMSFSGYDGKARYGVTPIAEILPVKVLNYDDRIEKPEGCYPVICPEHTTHPVLKDLPMKWPVFLGYNKTIALEGNNTVISTICGDPFIAVSEPGNGRCAIFSSDCAPHWGTMDFIQWEGYDILWRNIANWLTKQR